MGVMSGLLGTLFGSGRNVVTETVQVFRENAENGAMRDAALNQAALAQFAAEFAHPRKSIFDQVIDGLNRIPRPAMALGTLGLFVTAMVDPIWFAARMQGIALVPEPLWWLMGAIVGFYFGARHQAKGQDFQRSIADSLARAGQVTEGMAVLESLRAGRGGDRTPTTAQIAVETAETAVVPEPADAEPEATDAAPELELVPVTGRFPDNAALAEWSHAHS